MRGDHSVVGDVLIGIQAGKSVKTKERPAQPGELGILKVSAVTWGEFRPQENKAVLDGYDPGDCPRPMHGDLLISRANTRDLVGAPVLVEGDHPHLLLSDKILRLIVDDARVDRRYLARALRSAAARKHFESRAGGTSGSMTNVTQDDIRSAPLPLPPLVEQRRIADLLDKVDAIRRKRKEAIALTEELLHSAFLEMFGDPVTNPKGWPVKPLGEVCERLDAGWSANGDARLRNDEEYGVLKVSAVTSGVFRPEEHKAVPASAIDRELVTPRAGDLLFSRANTRELVAATCLVERDEPRLFLSDKLWRVVPRNGVTTAPYLRFLLGHSRFRSELTKSATGTSGSMLNVSMDKLRALRGPSPPFELQQRFSNLVWRSLNAKTSYETAQRTADRLFNSLVSNAFSGGLAS
ncbi:restriction endonuclease subunit S [Sorangium sp. So ce394]|uniref:restriction endonuclease subunit S n=1 Tax=Sorangium sp. So ce394 TaxID=3133310 RepID=UPI003F5AEF7C